MLNYFKNINDNILIIIIYIIFDLIFYLKIYFF